MRAILPTSRVLENAQRMGVQCGVCGSQMEAVRVLAYVWRGQYADNAPFGIVLFQCAGTLECGTEAHVEVDA